MILAIRREYRATWTLHPRTGRRLSASTICRANSRDPWITPHALRHTHATRMWEGGMRELTLQKRLGHASPESTRIYTQVSDPIMVAEYRRALGEEVSE